MIWQRKLRSSLTILSILIGITAIFALVSFGQGINSYMNEFAQEMGTDKIFLMPGGGLASAPGTSNILFTEDDMVPFLQFKEVDGKSYDYERELTNPTTSVVGDEGDMTDSSMTFTEKSTTLKTTYVQTAVNLKSQALANKNNPEAVARLKMAKSFGRELSRLVIKGDTTVDSEEFDGLDAFCRDETRMLAMDDGALDGPGTAETELTIARLRVLLDLVEPGLPDALIMNKTMRRKLTNLAYAAGGGIELPSIEMFGRRTSMFDNIPIIINDYITSAEQYADASTWPSSTATTIFAVKFGEEKEGFTLLHKGGFMDVNVQELGTRKNRNEKVLRMVGYPGSVVYSPLSIAALGGIDSAA